MEGEVRRTVLALEARWRGLLAELVQQAIDLEHLGKHVEVDQFVWELCGIYLSHHASRRFLRDAAADARAMAAFEALLERGRPRPGDTSRSTRRVKDGRHHAEEGRR